MSKKSINMRGLVSLVSFLAFLGLGLTGILLYIVPQGRVAYWVNWRLIGLTKDDWAHIHTLLALLFLIAAVFHIVLNWKPLWRYVAGRAESGPPLIKELTLAVIVSALFLLGAMLMLPPFSYVVDMGQAAAAKDSWVISEDYEPPFGHAEEVSLRTFCSRMNINLTEAMAALKKQGINFDSQRRTLAEICSFTLISVI